MRQTRQDPVQDRTAERSLSAAERAVLHRLLAVLPGGAPELAGQLAGARVLDLVGWVDGLPAQSVIVLEHWRSGELVALPVRGFSVDEAGAPVGELVVWAHDGRFVGYRHRATGPGAVPGAVDPEMLDAVPWPDEVAAVRPTCDTVPTV